MATVAIPRRAHRPWSAARRRNLALHLLLPATALAGFSAGLATARMQYGVPASRPATVQLAAPRPVLPFPVELGDELESARPRPPAAGARPAKPAPRFPRRDLPIRWRRSTVVGLPYAGHLKGGVQLPPYGRDFVTWDAPRAFAPNPGGRRYGTARLVRLILAVAAAYHRAHPRAPRLVIQDLSRRGGGSFGAQYGGLGHSSHQNGLDVDVAYPRRDGREIGLDGTRQMSRSLAQDLVDRFVRAGAQYVFVGYHTGLRRPGGVVIAIPYHDDHMHVRISG